MSSKDFELAFVVIGKFKFPRDQQKIGVQTFSELWKTAQSRGLIPEIYVSKVELGGGYRTSN